MARPKKLWKVTIGGYGHTVSALERAAGGTLYLRWFDARRGQRGAYVLKSLGHRDRVRAEAQATTLAGQLLSAVEGAHLGRLTLLEVFARYEVDVTRHKKGAQPKEDTRRMALWQAFMGSARDVRTIDYPTLDRFVRARRAGGIEAYTIDARGLRVKLKLTASPQDRTIGADIEFLQIVLNHATRITLADGTRLLAVNPIRGYEAPRSKNPTRPVVTYDRFLKIREKANVVDPQRLFGAFLDVIEGLGWRVSAICLLQASDVDRKRDKTAPHGRLKKRGDVDKEGVEMWIPLSENVRAALDRAIAANSVIGDLPIFQLPRASRPGAPRPWTRWHARDLLERAEQLAGLEHVKGGDFHPFRRKWVSERKHLPSRDVAAAGGWRDLRTMERSYQQMDEHTLLAVVTEPAKLRDAERA